MALVNNEAHKESDIRVKKLRFGKIWMYLELDNGNELSKLKTLQVIDIIRFCCGSKWIIKEKE